MGKLIRLRKTATQDLAAGALAFSYTFLRDGYLDFIEAKLSAACSQAVVVTKDNVTGAAYDAVLKSETLSSATAWTYQPTRKIPFAKGDILLIGITSGGTAVAGLTIHLEEVMTWAS